jgi:riboflavin biosynthesis pyrimidine reductase
MFGSLLAVDLVEELFLTRSPLLASRGDGARLGLVDGNALLPAVHRDRLLSVCRARDHLFLRYQLRPT